MANGNTSPTIMTSATLADRDKSNAQTSSTVSSSQPFSIYTGRQKNFMVLLISVVATLSGFASNIYFPSLPAISADLSVSTQLVNLSVTSYLIFQGLSPTFWGVLSDTHGRRITYVFTLIVFIGACIGLAYTSSYAQLIVLRCVQSTGSASTIAIGAGVIGDVTTREERGGYMGYFQAGLLLPTAIGPLIGGALADTLGWRSVFWFLAIYSGFITVVLVAILPETMRSLVGNGSIPPKGIGKSFLSWWRQRQIKSKQSDTNTPVELPPTPAPKKSIDLFGAVRILTQPQAVFAVIFVGVYYMIWQMVLTVLATLFKTTYNMSDLQIGLVYIANGVGCILGTALTGKFLDYDYRRIHKGFSGDPQDFPLERARLRTVWLYAPVQCAAVLVFGWALNKDVNMSVPIICLFFLGWTAISIQSIVSTFLVDIYPDRSASATAALNLVRCLLGAGGTAAVTPCINAIGVGWTFTLFVAIMLACIGLILLQTTRGPSWRAERLLLEGRTNP